MWGWSKYNCRDGIICPVVWEVVIAENAMAWAMEKSHESSQRGSSFIGQTERKDSAGFNDPGDDR